MIGRRAMLFAALALAVPLPALAIPSTVGTGDPSPTLTVSASLDTCGTAANSIVCKIDASWNPIPGATRYTASVTRADGSVVDFGDVGAGSESFWVPYVGNGSYSVSISAYGTRPGSNEPEVVAKGSSDAGQKGPKASSSAAEVAPAVGEVPTEEPTDPGTDPGTEPEEPTCEEPEPPVEPPVPAPEQPADGSSPLSAEATAVLDETAELPTEVECPDPAAEPAPATG